MLFIYGRLCRSGSMWLCIRLEIGGKPLSIRLRGGYSRWPKMVTIMNGWRRCINCLGSIIWKVNLCCGFPIAFYSFHQRDHKVISRQQIGITSTWRKCVTHAPQYHWHAIFPTHVGFCRQRIWARYVNQNRWFSRFSSTWCTWSRINAWRASIRRLLINLAF